MKNIRYFLLLIINVFILESQNNALCYLAGNDDVSLNYSSALDFDKNDPLTIETWVKTDASYAAIIWSNHIDISPFVGTEVAIVNGKAVFEMLNNFITNGIRVETVNNAVNDNNWHHLAFVYKGIPSAASCEIYLDGVLQALNVSTNNLSSSPTNNNAPHIGSRNNTTYFSNITLDELRIWKRALCGSEIQARKNCYLNGNEPQLEAYYSFDQGIAGGNNSSVTSLIDKTGNGHTGTLTGFALNGPASNWISSTAPVSGNCGSYGGLTISGTSTVCAGDIVSLSVGGASTYTWYPGTISGATVTVSPTVSTEYTVFAQNFTTGCVASAATSVNVNALPGITINSSNGLYFCNTGSTTLTASGADTFTWSTSSQSNSISISPSSTTSYTVSGTNTLTGCENSASVNINVANLPTVSINSSTSSICFGKSATLTANGANTYSWNTSSTNTSIIVSPTTSSVYTVTGYNSPTCYSTNTINLTVFNLPSVLITGTNGICIGNTATLSVSGADSYTWNTSSTNTLIAVMPNSTTTYSVVGTNTTTGCSAGTSISLVVYNLPVISINTATSSICFGQNALLTANGAITYTWNTSATGPTILATPSSNSIYTVTGTSGVGCVSNKTIAINVMPLPNVAINAPVTSICRGGNINLFGGGANSYTWSTGNTTGGISVSPSVTTTYSVVGMDATTSCTNSSAVTVTVTDCTGVAEWATENNSIVVFPNPNNGNFTIKSNEGLTIRIFNSIGQKLFEKVINANEKLSISDFPSGIYFIFGENDSRKWQKKVVVSN